MVEIKTGLEIQKNANAEGFGHFTRWVRVDEIRRFVLDRYNKKGLTTMEDKGIILDCLMMSLQEAEEELRGEK